MSSEFMQRSPKRLTKQRSNNWKTSLRPD